MGEGLIQFQNILENKRSHTVLFYPPKNLNWTTCKNFSYNVYSCTEPSALQPSALQRNEEIQKYLDICFIDISEEILYPIIISHIMEHHKSLSLKPVKVDI